MNKIPQYMLQPQQRPTGATGIAVVRPNRNIATPAPRPTPTVPHTGQTQGQVAVDIYAYFTTVGAGPGGTAPVLYSGDRDWAVIELTLETAGPVVVSQRPNLFPVLSGKGQLLPTGVPVSFSLARGDKLYCAAEAVNRINVQIHDIPWLQGINANLQDAVTCLKQLLLKP